MSETSSERVLVPTYDSKGNPAWNSTMSAPDNSYAVCHIVPDRIIPIIFIPGVMGSNLKGIGTAKNIQWRLDGASSMLGWLTRGPIERKRYLTPETMTVDDGGELPEGTSQHKDELKRRGWGEVGAMSYATFLVWLENALSDFSNPHGGERDRLIERPLGASKGESALRTDEVALSYRYRFPVHACGYNWLDSNAMAAKRLQQRINEVIARYKGERKQCEKVILVTHSMGGLVARYCSEVLGMSDKIFGIVHGVMPSIGAAAVYRRFKSGTEGDWIASKILGEDAAEMTAVLSGAPGPLQLLPTEEYGNNWLKINDGNTVFSFPQRGDPYEEIYTIRGKWWSMCEEDLISPIVPARGQTKPQAKLDQDWIKFATIISEQVETFHKSIQGKYHRNTYAFYGSSPQFLSYGTVTWKGGTTWSETWFTSRKADTLNARMTNEDNIHTSRSLATPLQGDGGKKGVHQMFTISGPDENGDGTVPHRSGVRPKDSPYVKSIMEVAVGHEPAYKDSRAAMQFTLRAIVRIAQAVKGTSLAYD
ncbi:hypothetical protein J2S30_002436 [Herbaspirillum rubrisubalbicans]|uniref:esterase/lipase family protein n=1 Tax=Herbaspirillum rubrisubalbicans TaxID=80842 RepID=UPI0020A14775|nr:hypothetical protein [Herbaspirillum rubrisubalbicans]MCP1574057.1 hypothetical protein [Herbaspirillum rubrisubalbicans]